MREETFNGVCFLIPIGTEFWWHPSVGRSARSEDANWLAPEDRVMDISFLVNQNL